MYLMKWNSFQLYTVYYSTKKKNKEEKDCVIAARLIISLIIRSLIITTAQRKCTCFIYGKIYVLVALVLTPDLAWNENRPIS